jgi:hypothetical protein
VEDHPAFVRVIVSTTRGSFTDVDVFAPDFAPYADGTARVQVRRPTVAVQPASMRSQGLRVSAREDGGRVTVRISAAAHRFKYVAHRARHPRTLVIDLWKSAPPTRDAVIRRGVGGCLTLDRFVVSDSLVNASGRERGLFEHMFLLRLRRADGRVIAQHGVAADRGRWRADFRHARVRPQAATLEAVDTSEGDGSLVCIAQAQVPLP